MSYEDRISIATPEGVELDVTLAGVGSRFVAALVDQAIQWAILLALLLLGVVVVDVGSGDSGVLLFGAAMALAFFVVQFGYPVLFETRASGRTPGKRWTGLRVVRVGGGPVTFTASAIRNLLRVVDALPGAYAVGMIAILVSSRNQRLGDMAAGTLVIRERTGDQVKPVPPWLRAELRDEPSDEARTWDVSAVTADEMVAVRRFLELRTTLTDEARARLAADLALRLRPKVVGPRDGVHPEDFLLDLAAVKATRG
ncbi:MAG: RDD family protein [Actinobacteria bacterium]|nr:RDD family protein [Actinomycetota bacterium]